MALDTITVVIMITFGIELVLYFITQTTLVYVCKVHTSTCMLLVCTNVCADVYSSCCFHTYKMYTLLAKQVTFSTYVPIYAM